MGKNRVDVSKLAEAIHPAETKLEEQLKEVIEQNDDIKDIDVNEKVDLEKLAEENAVGAIVAEEVIKPTVSEGMDLVASVQAALQNEASTTIEVVVAEVNKESPVLTSFKETILKYMDSFAPGKPHPDSSQSAAMQLALVRRLRNAPDALGEHFNAAMTWFLEQVVKSQAEKGCFHDDYLYRFFDDARMRKSPEEREDGLMLLSFITAVAKPATRKNIITQIDIPRVLRIFKTESAQRQIQNYFEFR